MPRKPKLTDAQREAIYRMLGEGDSIASVARVFNVSSTTVRKVRQQHKNAARIESKRVQQQVKHMKEEVERITAKSEKPHRCSCGALVQTQYCLACAISKGLPLSG